VIYARPMQSRPAPIVVFAYNRPDHLRGCLTSLAANPQAKKSVLTIYCDGPKPNEDVTNIETVRKIAQEWACKAPSAFAEIRVVEQKANMGLAKSVISGVTQELVEYDRIIVVEDDLVVSPDFLAFMNEGLELYEHDSEVISIHGFMYALETDVGQSVFLRGADCWGWATWRRGWELFRHDSTELLRELKQRDDRKDFDFNGAFPYTTMLKEQAAGNIDSWAIRWYASAFLADKLTLYPGRSLVSNVGQDSSGTHFKGQSQARFSHQPQLSWLQDHLTRIEIKEIASTRAAVEKSLGAYRGGTRNIVQEIKSLLSNYNWIR
jgi:Glycosyl transferase family 2